ncbi:28S ribosomal protein S7, mitochondrial-like [Daphnia pulex]|uniref:28S ribosomal protein S7, mitochondrial-like n=1 Tax=Daphnia pulex TaxID=6669 RepID=UPI001EDCD708|nr:28S ribosomal protein S7, mitochondrial-like [Daphnia pulex]XP_046644199.1 28S ribosomal protein S7, mitochondrial-like [Daphnia pulicaria]
MSLSGLLRTLPTINAINSSLGSLSLLSRQPYSMYKPFVKEPVYNIEQLDKLIESGEAKKREFVPVKAARNDHNVSVFYDDLTSKFVNMVMVKGQKELARNLVEMGYMKVKQIQLAKYYEATTDAERAEIELNPITIFHKALENCSPVLQLTPIKRGGSTYQVPIPITENRARFLAMKWMILECREKERKIHFPERLAVELIDAFNNTGKVVKRKQDLHKQCENNRAYAHYRWG